MGWLGKGTHYPPPNRISDMIGYGKLDPGVLGGMCESRCASNIVHSSTYSTARCSHNPTKNTEHHDGIPIATTTTPLGTARKLLQKFFESESRSAPPPLIKARLQGPRNNHPYYHNPKQKHPTSNTKNRYCTARQYAKRTAPHEPNPYSTPSTPVSHTSKSSHRLQSSNTM